MMDRLNEVLNKKYRQYRQMMDYLSHYFGWGAKDFVRWIMYGQIR
jgi:hypothetical protein